MERGTGAAVAGDDDSWQGWVALLHAAACSKHRRCKRAGLVRVAVSVCVGLLGACNVVSSLDMLPSCEEACE